MKYSPDGGEIAVRVAASAERAYVSVADQGVGIDSEDIPRIFTRFARLHEKRLAQIGGTGLGLYLAREIARRHGGDMLVESRPREGSRFTLSLPLRRPPDLTEGRRRR